MSSAIKVKRLRGATIFKIVVFYSAIGCAVISTIFGLFALFGVETVQWNGEYVTGVKGLLVSPFVGFFAGGFLGLFVSIFVYIGSRIAALLGGMEIEFIPFSETE